MIKDSPNVYFQRWSAIDCAFYDINTGALTLLVRQMKIFLSLAPVYLTLTLSGESG